MLGSQLVAIFQLVAVMMCTAVAFGLLLSTMLVRGKLHSAGPDAARYDIAFTEKAYLAASAFCAVGAMAAISRSWGSFALFVAVAASFQLADHLLVPRMRLAQEEGRALPLTGVRSRFELVAAACLFFIFWKTAYPPLATLAQIYGIG
jgi:hypothetical protein